MLDTGHVLAFDITNEEAHRLDFGLTLKATRKVLKAYQLDPPRKVNVLRYSRVVVSCQHSKCHELIRCTNVYTGVSLCRY